MPKDTLSLFDAAPVTTAPPTPLDYFADTPNHLSGSDLRAGLLNADDALWKRLHPSATRAMDAGSAIHLALLEGHKFHEQVAIRPEGLRRGTKAGDAWYEENADKYAVSQDIYDRAELYVGGYQPALEDITDGQLDYFEQVNERPIYWTDPIAGLCRCKPDTLLRGPKCISVSVKTTAKPVNTELWTYQLISGSRSAGYDIAEYHYARGIADHHLGSPERWAEVEVWHVVATTAGAPRLHLRSHHRRTHLLPWLRHPRQQHIIVLNKGGSFHECCTHTGTVTVRRNTLLTACAHGGDTFPTTG
jgi:hypothetical protein